MAYVFRFLDTNGDGTGTNIATGDYSGAATPFYIQPPAGQIYLIERMLVHIGDAPVFSSDEYGNLNTALTNGITVAVYRGTEEIADLTGGLPITTNAEWGRVCYDVSNVSFGAGDDFVQVRWTFSKSGKAVKLDSTLDLRVILNDSFAGLTNHTFMVQGHSGTLGDSFYRGY